VRRFAAALGLAVSVGGTPYLDRHADDAVRFRPFGEAAFAEAREKNRLVFVSVGFFACNGCHVMEAESFEDAEMGALFEARVVPVLVDRADRPDLDARFARELRRFGVEVGWPMTLWLLPDGRAVSAATYLGPAELRVRTERLAELWAREPARLLAVADASSAVSGVEAAAKPVTIPAARENLRRLAAAVAEGFDEQHGGLRGAPKFPRDLPTTALFVAERSGIAGAAAPATRTLDAILGSALHDRVDGGFHRYAVDSAWQEPHWEKTLEDNVLLALDLLDAWRVTGQEAYRQGARSTLAFVQTRLALSGGRLAQALDSDRVYYQRPASERARSQPPARDDSVVVAPNAHAARALARAGAWFGEPESLDRARGTLDALLAARRAGVLPHSLRRGSGPASLADHAALGLAALDFFAASGEVGHLEAARQLDLEIARSFTAEDGGLLEFLDGSRQVLEDRPAPSGAALGLELAARLSLLDPPADRSRVVRAQSALARLSGAIADEPVAHADALLASLILERPIEIVIAVSERRDARPWVDLAARRAPLRALVLIVDDAGRRATEAASPLATGKTPKRGRARAFVCQGQVCDRPADELETFQAQLAALR
jgi:uncharacterized protein YyaL (SSP411 family)